MRVAFASRGLERCYARERDAVRRWGSAAGSAYVRTVDLLQVVTWSEALAVPQWRLHRLRGQRAGQWAIDLHGRWRLHIRYGGGESVTIEEVSRHYGD